LKHGGDLEVFEDTGENGSVLTITVKTGATSESFAIEGGTIDDLRAVLEQEIVRHQADHYRYREATERIPPARLELLRRGSGKGINLSAMNLRGVNLHGVNLHGADLRGAGLIGRDLSGADLRGANLGGADLTWVNLRGANLSGANLSGVNLHQTFLGGVTLHQTTFSLEALVRCSNQLT
ncbi:pentapeptide repeat-containing protein, partial [Paraburkholderia sp. RL17-373-BIF-A]|uniref:pentapeptide repeat-containing protein n=1 Tax=Paraburkholderia sp. RL17-373-BIF-A TaxID=3031629 RepID=UPI0038BAA10F